jgi:hypothetical protein
MTIRIEGIFLGHIVDGPRPLMSVVVQSKSTSIDRVCENHGTSETSSLRGKGP